IRTVGWSSHLLRGRYTRRSHDEFKIFSVVCEADREECKRMSELHQSAEAVPSSGRHDLVLVDGRTFAISDEHGNMWRETHGIVHDDLRHLSQLVITVPQCRVELLAASTPTPLTAVVVSRLDTVDLSDHDLLVVRRRWLAGGLREEIAISNPHPRRIKIDVE